MQLINVLIYPRKRDISPCPSIRSILNLFSPSGNGEDGANRIITDIEWFKMAAEKYVIEGKCAITECRLSWLLVLT